MEKTKEAAFGLLCVKTKVSLSTFSNMLLDMITRVILMQGEKKYKSKIDINQVA